MRTDPRALAVVYLKGFAMGTADAVPGVSGGTIAFITGIYERLIAALTAIGPGRVRATLAGVLPGRRDAAEAALREMDVPFLLALGSGMVTAIVFVTSSVEYAAEAHPLPTFGFFFGLIAASAVVLWENVSLDTRNRRVAAAAGFLLAFLVSGNAVSGLGHSPVVTFVAGSIAISAMILPGISGSLILLILGQYLFIVGTLSALREAVVGVVTGSESASALLARRPRNRQRRAPILIELPRSVFRHSHARGRARTRYLYQSVSTMPEQVLHVRGK